jgi:hypothetical protein
VRSPVILLRDMVFWLTDSFEKSACRRALPTEGRDDLLNGFLHKMYGEYLQLDHARTDLRLCLPNYRRSGHESPRTTKLYDRAKDEITLSEVERIRL